MCRRSGKLSDREALVIAIIDFCDRRARENACAKGSFGVDYLTIVCGESGQRRRRRVWDAICYQVVTGGKVEAATDLSWLFFESGMNVAFSLVCFSTLLVLAHQINARLQEKAEVQAQASSVTSEGEA